MKMIDGVVSIIKNDGLNFEIEHIELVKCKNCKYWNPHIKECEGIGKWFGLEDEWSENGFCFKGERREE